MVITEGTALRLCKKPCRDELHAFWDDLPGKGKDPATAVTVGKKLPKPDSTLAANGDTSTWVAESFDAAQKSVYVNPPIGDGNGPFTLTAAYRTHARKIANDRVALAGARLANVINSELK